MYIRNDIPFSHRHDLGSDDLELLCCDLLLPKSKPIVVGVCYRPPNKMTLLRSLKRKCSKLELLQKYIFWVTLIYVFFRSAQIYAKNILDL